jgi:hypothetical protein
MSNNIFQKPTTVASLTAKRNTNVAGYAMARQEMAAISIGTDIAVTIIGGVVAQICVTAWPF